MTDDRKKTRRQQKIRAALASPETLDSVDEHLESMRGYDLPARDACILPRLSRPPARVADIFHARRYSIAEKMELSSEQWDIVRQCIAYDQNDIGNGERLLDWYGTEILFVIENGWFYWENGCWSDGTFIFNDSLADSTSGQLFAQSAAQNTALLMKLESGLIQVENEEEERAIEALPELSKLNKNERTEEDEARIRMAVTAKKRLAQRRQRRFDWAITSGNTERQNGMLRAAMNTHNVQPGHLDREKRALNVANGTLRFERYEDPESSPDDPRYMWRPRLDPHQRSDLFSKRCAARWSPDAEAPNFLNDLRQFVPDTGTQEFLQVFFGYTMFGGVGAQKIAFFYGSGGNWKSALCQAVVRTVGSYARPQHYSSVSGDRLPSSDKPSPEWARLQGVRFLLIEEVKQTERLKEELIKLLTSGSAIPVRKLNRDIFDLKPDFTCVLTSNGVPNIANVDDGIWRRLAVVHFTEVIKNQRDFEEVMSVYEAERDGILRWIVEGMCKYLSNGLDAYITSEMRSYASKLRAERDSVGSFISDCVWHAPGLRVQASDLYRSFTEYCRRNAIDPILSGTGFGTSVKNCSIPDENGQDRTLRDRYVRDRGRNYYCDIDIDYSMIE